MATVEDIVGQVTEANVLISDVIGALGQTKEAEEAVLAQLSEAKNNFGNALGAAVQARDLIAQTVGSSGSATLNEMLGMLQSAIDDHMTASAARFDEAISSISATVSDGEEASNKCAAAMEAGESYIGMALG